MAIRLPKYEEQPRRPMPVTTPIYPRIGERWRAEETYFQKTAELRRQGIESSRRYARTQLALNLVQIGADLFTKFGGMWAEVKAAETQAQLNDASMETIKGFTDLMSSLEDQQVPQEFLNRQAITADSDPSSTYRNWYAYEAEQLYEKALDQYKSQITNPRGQAAYEEWLNGFFGKAYADFSAAGLDRDARVATSTAFKNLRQAIDTNDWQMAEAIISTNVASGVWSPEYGERLREVIPSLKANRALERARPMGLAGPAWLVSEQAQELFDITPEQGQNLAVQLTQEFENKQTFEYLKNRDRILEDFNKAVEDIYSGAITPANVGDLQDPEKYYLDPAHQNTAKQVFQDYWDEQQEHLNEYKEERFTLIGDLIEAGEFGKAQAELNNLRQVKGLVLGPRDQTDFDRLQWMIDNAGDPSERDEFTQEVLAFERKLAGPEPSATWADFDEFTAFVEEGDFGQRGETKVAHFREQMEQLDKRRAEEAEERRLQRAARSPTAQPYWEMYNDVMELRRETHTVEDLLELKNEIGDNIGPDPITGEQRIKTTDARTMFNAINRRMKELRSDAYKDLQAELETGREFITDWYEDKIKKKQQEIEAAFFQRKKEQLQGELADLHREKQTVLEQYDNAAPKGDDPVETAKQLLLPAQRIKVRDSLTGQRRLESDQEYYERTGTPELIGRPGYAPPEGLTPEEITGPELPSVLEARRMQGAAAPEQELRQAEQIKADNRIISKYNNYRRTADGTELAASLVYNNQPAPDGKAWVYNEAVGRVELISIEELSRFKQAMARRQ